MKINKTLTEAALDYRTQEMKMDAWYNGTRGANVSSMSDEKLKMNYDICRKKGYDYQAALLMSEAEARGLEWSKAIFDLSASALAEISRSYLKADYYNRVKDAVISDLYDDIDKDKDALLAVMYLLFALVGGFKNKSAALLDYICKEFKATKETIKIIINNYLESPDFMKALTAIVNGEIKEDLTKKADHKWVNKGADGEHGTFKTKKAAREQQKAMFANGYKESINEGMSKDEMIAEIKNLGYNYKFDKHSEGEIWNILQWARNQADKNKATKNNKVILTKIPKYCQVCGTQLNDSGECPLCDLGDESVMYEAAEKHSQLNPKLFENEQLKQEVRDKILDIVDEFTNKLEEDEIKFNIKDIILVGSNCSYNYTKDSDLDIHILAETNSLECPDNLYPKLYSAYRSLFNKNIDIDFYGIPVELYVQTEETPLHSNGIYSVLNNKWIKKPVQEEIPDIDKEVFDKEFKVWEDRYNEIVNSGKKELKESAIVKDTKNLSNKDKAELGWDKQDGWYVNKLYFVGPDADMYQKEFHKIFPTEEAAKKFFDKLN